MLRWRVCVSTVRLGVQRPSIVERQRRLTPFNDFGSQYLLPTDPPHLSWSDGSLEPVEEKIVEGEWELMIHAASTDANGWNFAFNWEFVFHSGVTSKDLVRKRIWLRCRHDEFEDRATPRLPDHRGGIRGHLRVTLTAEEQGALEETTSSHRAAMHDAEEVECMHALFGKVGEVDGTLVWAQPDTADEDLHNLTQLCGNIALVRRDAPDERRRTGFVDKAFRAVAAGARAVVLVNTTDDLLAPWVWTYDLCDADQVQVPVVCVRARDEHTLRPGMWCQLSFRIRPSPPPHTRSAATSAAADKVGGGEWEWAADLDKREGDDEEEAGDSESWLHHSKLLLQQNARWLASLASNTPLPAVASTTPLHLPARIDGSAKSGHGLGPASATTHRSSREWAVEEDGAGWEGEALPAIGQVYVALLHVCEREGGGLSCFTHTLDLSLALHTLSSDFTHTHFK